MMQIQYCFPTAIFSTVDENFADQMLPIAKQYLNDGKYINPNWHYKSTYYPSNFGIETEANMQPFSNYIIDLGAQFLQKQGYKPSPVKFSSFIFINEMNKGDVHGQHAHPNSVLSGCFYLQVPDKSAPIIFYDPKGRQRYVSRSIDFPTDSNINELSIKPKKGLLLMWESWLDHAVPKNESVGRISIAFNLGFRM